MSSRVAREKDLADRETRGSSSCCGVPKEDRRLNSWILKESELAAST